MRNATIAAACATATLLCLTGCGLTESNKQPAKSKGTITVTSADDSCTLSSTKAPSGNLVFKVKNTGTKVTEFYLYRADGKSIVAEVENVGPGLSRPLVVRADPGKYVTACKPGMVGKGIRGDFTVTGTGKAAPIKGLTQADLDQATEHYKEYVEQQSDELLHKTTAFVAAYRAGKDDRARALYSTAREPWERIEPVAESFGDLDPKTDAREADLEPGQRWTGWHRIEKDLWPPAKGYRPMSQAQRTTFGADLLANVTTLHTRVPKLTFTVDQIGNGAKSLLDEVATGKITGEEDIWSHTDLYDFQANVVGAKEAFEALEPLLNVKDPGLRETIDERFDTLQAQLDKYRKGAGFVSYAKVTQAQRRALSDSVNALSEPLSKMTGAITL